MNQNSKRMKNRVRNLSQADPQLRPAPLIDHSFQPQPERVAVEVDISFEGMVILGHAEHRLLNVRSFDSMHEAKKTLDGSSRSIGIPCFVVLFNLLNFYGDAAFSGDSGRRRGALKVCLPHSGCTELGQRRHGCFGFPRDEQIRRAHHTWKFLEVALGHVPRLEKSVCRGLSLRLVVEQLLGFLRTYRIHAHAPKLRLVKAHSVLSKCAWKSSGLCILASETTLHLR